MYVDSITQFNNVDTHVRLFGDDHYFYFFSNFAIVMKKILSNRSLNKLTSYYHEGELRTQWDSFLWGPSPYNKIYFRARNRKGGEISKLHVENWIKSSWPASVIFMYLNAIIKKRWNSVLRMHKDKPDVFYRDVKESKGLLRDIIKLPVPTELLTRKSITTSKVSFPEPELYSTLEPGLHASYQLFFRIFAEIAKKILRGTVFSEYTRSRTRRWLQWHSFLFGLDPYTAPWYYMVYENKVYLDVEEWVKDLWPARVIEMLLPYCFSLEWRENVICHPTKDEHGKKCLIYIPHGLCNPKIDFYYCEECGWNQSIHATDYARLT